MGALEEKLEKMFSAPEDTWTVVYPNCEAKTPAFMPGMERA